MFASRRSPFFRRRRRAQYSIGAMAGLAVATAVAAAAAVYLLDSESGQRRRALLRDQALNATRRGRDLASKVGRGARQRATAMFQRQQNEMWH